MNIDSFWFKRWRWVLALLALTLLAFFIRGYYVTITMVAGPIRGDAIQYYAYAWNLAHHGTFAKDAPGAVAIVPDSYRDPGYPVFLAIWMKLFNSWGSWYAAILLCQACLGSLTATLTAMLGRYWLSPPWAIAAGLLAALWPHTITNAGYLLSETLFGFVCVLSVALLARACSRQDSRWMLAAGTTMSLAALTNAIFLPFGPLLGIFLYWRKLVSPKLCIALAVGAMAIPCCWAIRNSQIVSADHEASSLARAQQNLEQGSRPEFQLAWRNSVLGDEAAKSTANLVLQDADREYHLMRSSPLLAAKALAARFVQQPLHYALWYLIQKPYLLWGWDIQIGQGDIYVFPVVNSPFQTMRAWIALEVITRALNPLLFLLAILAFGFTGSTLKRPGSQALGGRVALTTTLGVFVFVTMIYSALQAEPRYSTPFRPFEMLLAATAVSDLASRWRKHRAASQAKASVDRAGTP